MMSLRAARHTGSFLFALSRASPSPSCSSLSVSLFETRRFASSASSTKAEETEQQKEEGRSFYNTDKKSGKRVENSDTNFFQGRDEETRRAQQNPKKFRQDQGKAWRWFGHASNVLFFLSGMCLIVSTLIFQLIFSETFSGTLEGAVKSARRNYWTRRNEATDSKMHDHSSVHDMLGLKSYSVTTSGDDVLTNTSIGANAGAGETFSKSDPNSTTLKAAKIMSD